MLTIKELREALAAIPASCDDQPIVVWLPGSRIDLTGTPRAFVPSSWNTLDDKPCLLIEGNLREGSVLS